MIRIEWPVLSNRELVELFLRSRGQPGGRGDEGVLRFLFRSRPGFVPAVDAHLPDVEQRVVAQFRDDARAAAAELAVRNRARKRARRERVRAAVEAAER